MNPYALNSTQMSRNGENMFKAEIKRKSLNYIWLKDDEEMKKSTDQPTNQATNEPTKHTKQKYRIKKKEDKNKITRGF